MGVQDHQDLGEREVKDNALAVAAPVGRGISMPMPGKPGQPGGKGNHGDSGGNGSGDGEGNGKKDAGVDNSGGGQTDKNTKG